MRIVYLTHSLVSCWNHGNAHFQRGLLRELASLGHDVTAWEPKSGWSRQNLLVERGELAIARSATLLGGIDVRTYEARPCADELIAGADLVIVHEWTEPALIAAIGSLRKRSGGWSLLFHDTHHRAVSDPDSMRRLDLSGYDGVLAFGQSLADVYERMGWRGRVHVLHEAADIHLFRPPLVEEERRGVAFVGNWGDDERSGELSTYLLGPARDLGLPLTVHGVRYPDEGLAALAAHGAHYRGWLANVDVPSFFARHLITVHVPRRFYAQMLPGIPTIRVFEALACGIPLLSAPWDDCEELFLAGRDFIMARDEAGMREAMRALVSDAGLRHALARSGLERIRERHSCAHRALELISIAQLLRPTVEEARPCA